MSEDHQGSEEHNYIVSSGSDIEFGFAEATSRLLTAANRIATQGHDMSRCELTELSQQVEAQARAVEALQTMLTGVMDQVRVASSPLGNSFGWEKEPEHPQYRNIKDFLTDTLRISTAEANRRVRLAKAVTPTRTVLGDLLPAAQPELSRLVLSGEVSAETAGIISRTVKEIKTLSPRTEEGHEAMQHLSPEQMGEAAEEFLCEQAPECGPAELGRLANRWKLFANPDGAEPTEKYLALKQGIFDLGVENDLHVILARMTSAQYEALMGSTDLLMAVEKRRGVSSDNGYDIAGADPVLLSTAGIEPTPAQKRLDALISLMQHPELVSPETDSHTTILATIDYDELFGKLKGASGTKDVDKTASNDETLRDAVTRAGGESFYQSSAQLQYSGPVSSSVLRKLACEAEIIPVVLGGDAQPLDLGRSRRLFTRAQRMALASRDKGCIFPGCDAPIGRCEAHHVDHWNAHDGETNVNNGALLCSYHHHVIHKGVWKLAIIDNLPWVIPPPWIDGTRKPRRNTFHTIGMTQPPGRSA